MTLAGFQAINCSVDFICLRAASELTCYFHTGWRSESLQSNSADSLTSDL